MGRKKISTQVYLEEAQLETLKELSAKTRVPMAIFIREAVADFIRKVEAEERAKAGRKAGGTR